MAGEMVAVCGLHRMEEAREQAGWVEEVREQAGWAAGVQRDLGACWEVRPCEDCGGVGWGGLQVHPRCTGQVLAQAPWTPVE